MKPTKLLLAAVFLLGSVWTVSAQQVTVRLRQVKLEQVLDEISRQTGYAFYHSSPTVDPDSLVSLDVVNVPLETALDKLFADTRIGYEIKNQKVYLNAKEERKTASTPPGRSREPYSMLKGSLSSAPRSSSKIRPKAPALGSTADSRSKPHRATCSSFPISAMTHRKSK